MRPMLFAVLVALSGCSLDLDRLRARDGGAAIDAPGLDAQLDAPRVDAPGLDAGGAGDAWVTRDGELVVLATIASPGSGARLAAGRDERGAFFVRVSPTGTEARLLTRTACGAEVSPDVVVPEARGNVVHLSDLDGDRLLDVLAADAMLLSVAFGGMGPGLRFNTAISAAHGVSTPIALGAGHFDTDGLEEVLVAGRGAGATRISHPTPRGLGGTTTVPNEFGATVLDLLAVDLDGERVADVVMLGASSAGAIRELLVVRGDPAGTLHEEPRRDVDDRAEGLAPTRSGSRVVAFGPNVIEEVHFPSGGWGPHTVTGAGFVDAVVVDLEADGDEEVVLADEMTRSLRAFRLGDGSLVVADEVALAGPLAGAELAAVDIDSDGRDEILVHVDGQLLVVGRRARVCP